MTHDDTNRLIEFVREFPNRRIVVVGDLIADSFIYGEISRVSREAPVLILRHERTEIVPGGAANCALNLARMNARVALIGMIGQDAAGAALLEKLNEANIDTSGIVSDRSIVTTTKMRVLAGGAHSTRQQVIRVDYELTSLEQEAATASFSSIIIENIKRALASPTCACIISDYNYGVAGDEVAAVMRESRRTSNVPVVVDSRFHLTRFSGFTSATPNESEVEELTNKRLTGETTIVEVGEDLRRRLDLDSLLITRGKDGMLLLEKDAAPLPIAAVGGREAVDVTGAGDTVIAAYTLALACGAKPEEAARLANHAGGLVVMKRGTATISADELICALKHQPDF